jgi:aspartate kinase
MEDVVVSGATIQKDMAKITIVGIENKPGNAAKLFTELAQAKVVVNDIIQTEISTEKANISFTVGTSDRKTAKETVYEIKEVLGFEDVFVRDDIAEVSIVGVGMRTHYGVADKMFGALADAKINIDSITTSEIRISCIIDQDQAEQALEAVCLSFQLDKPVENRT